MPNRECKIVFAGESGVHISSHGDVSEALGLSLGSRGLILNESDLSPEFFDLRTGLAGELFQKFTNYSVRVAIILRDFDAHGERFGELAYEHSKHPLIRFFNSPDEAEAWLAH
jgi:uncharacterized protein DUF4180